MACEVPSWPVAREDMPLAGRSWLKAAEALAALARAYPMAVLVGRAGMGKTQVLYHVCRALDCIYVDMTEASERTAAEVAALVAWRALSRAGPGARGRLAEAYRRYGYEGLRSLARGDPTWTLKAALELMGGRAVVALDELLPSSEDPRFFEAAYVLHRIRNMALPGSSFLVSMLPDVYEKVVDRIPPLGNMLLHVTVQLPDVVAEEEAREIVAAYCPERAREVRRLLEARPDMTVRELLLSLGGSPPRYVELPVE